MQTTITISQNKMEDKEIEKIPTDLVNSWKEKALSLTKEIDKILQSQADTSIAIEVSEHIQMIEDILSKEEDKEDETIEGMEKDKNEKKDYMNKFMKEDDKESEE